MTVPPGLIETAAAESAPGHALTPLQNGDWGGPIYFERPRDT